MEFKLLLVLSMLLQLRYSRSKVRKWSSNEQFRNVFSLIKRLDDELSCSNVVIVHDYDNIQLPTFTEQLITSYKGLPNRSVRVIVKPENYKIPPFGKSFIQMEKYLWNPVSYISNSTIEESCTLYYFSVHEFVNTSTWYSSSIIRPDLRNDYFVLFDLDGNSTSGGLLDAAFKEGFQRAVSVTVDTNDGSIIVRNYCWFCPGENETVPWFVTQTVAENDVKNWFSEFPVENYNGKNIDVYSLFHFSRAKISEYGDYPGGVPVRFLVLQSIENSLNFTATAQPPIWRTNLFAVLYNNVTDMTLMRHDYAQSIAMNIFGKTYPYGFQSAVFTVIPDYNAVRLNFFYFRSTYLFLFFAIGIAFFTFGVSTTISRVATQKLIGDRLPLEKLPVFLLPHIEFALPMLPSFRAARVSLLFWFLGLGALSAGYFASVYHHLTSGDSVDFPTSFEDMLFNTNYWIAAPITTTSLRDLSYSLVNEDDLLLVHSESECWRLVREERYYACLTLESETPDFRDVFIYKSPERTLLDFHFFNFPQKSVLHGKFDRIILESWETGLIDHWENMWKHRLARIAARRLFQFRKGDNRPSHYDYRARYSKLKLGETIGPFYFLTFSLALCIGIVITEMMIHQPKLNQIVPITDNDLTEIVTSDTQEARSDLRPVQSEVAGRDFRYNAVSPVHSIQSESDATLTVEVAIESSVSVGNRSEDILIQEIEELYDNNLEVVEDVPVVPTRRPSVISVRRDSVISVRGDSVASVKTEPSSKRDSILSTAAESVASIKSLSLKKQMEESDGYTKKDESVSSRRQSKEQETENLFEYM